MDFLYETRKKKERARKMKDRERERNGMKERKDYGEKKGWDR